MRLSCDYGQRHRFELQAGRRVAGAGSRAARDPVGRSGQFGRSALTADIAVPKDRSEAAMAGGIPVTYVPARNTVFCRWPWRLPSGRRGRHFPRRQRDRLQRLSRLPAANIIAAFERLANLATKAGVEGTIAISHPRAADSHDQGRNHPPRHRAGRRLQPDAQLLRSGSGGRPCGHCDACLLRAQGICRSGTGRSGLRA